MKIGIIGSGQAAVMAGHALVKMGIRPTFLDAGETLSGMRKMRVDTLASQPASEWRNSDVAPLMENKSVLESGVPRKHVYGVDFLYAENRPSIPAKTKGTKSAQTFARGGFSQGWGGAIMPAHDSDMAGWPFGRADLEPYYKEVLQVVPLSAGDDPLKNCFPTYAETSHSLKLDVQAKALLEDFNGPAFAEHQNGEECFLVGQARLAVRAEDCEYCGLCLSGCPYKVVYTADQLLDDMLDKDLADYQDGVVVHKLEEVNGKVLVHTKEMNGQPARVHEFDKVLLGAGAIGSTRILLESLERYDEEITLLDSDKFAVPFIRLRGNEVEWPQSNTLPALFMEARIPSVAPNWLHMQISSTNDLILQKLRSRDGLKVNLLGKLLSPIIGRLMVGFCGLHSDLSAKILLKLKQTSRGSVLELSKQENPGTRSIIKGYLKRLSKEYRRFRALFVPFMTVYWEPGITGHCGGSFPMTEKTEERSWNSSDLFGRPAGFEHVHIVDAAAFPSIPGTTVALLIMANAYRIAEHVGQEVR